MGFLDTILGRTKPARPNLDNLFGLPGAALTLEAGTGFRPTGTGSVCFRAAEGKAFSDIESEVTELKKFQRQVNAKVPIPPGVMEYEDYRPERRNG